MAHAFFCSTLYFYYSEFRHNSLHIASPCKYL
jgi:hypothetical protein